MSVVCLNTQKQKIKNQGFLLSLLVSLGACTQAFELRFLAGHDTNVVLNLNSEMPSMIKGDVDYELNFSYDLIFLAEAGAPNRNVVEHKLLISRDAGANFTTLTQLPLNTTSYTWRTPAENIKHVVIRYVVIDNFNRVSEQQTKHFEIRFTGPILTLNEEPKRTNAEVVETFSGKCETEIPQVEILIDDNNPQQTPCSPEGSWSYSLKLDSSSGDRNFKLRFYQEDPLGQKAEVQAEWLRDITPPQIKSLTFTKSNEGTRFLFNEIELKAEDATSGISKYCVISTVESVTTMSEPNKDHSCWIDLSATAPQKLEIKQNLRLGGLVLGNYKLFGWVKDLTGNVSQMPTEVSQIHYRPIAPPAISNAIAINNNNPVLSPSRSQLSVGNGDNLYVYWNASSEDALTTNPISMHYTLNGIDFIPMAEGVANTEGEHCSIDNTHFSGCVRISSPAPSSKAFWIRIAAEDRNSQTSTTSAPPLNMGQFRLAAGNLDTGVGGSATSAVLSIGGGYVDHPKHNAFVVTDTGRIFIADSKRGLLSVDPQDGVLKVFIPKGSALVGDGKKIDADTRVVNVYKIALDYENGLLIADGQRIRRVDLATQHIDTVVGGGSQEFVKGVTSTLNPRDLKIVDFSEQSLFVPGRHGKIYFRAKKANASSWLVYVPEESVVKEAFSLNGVIKFVMNNGAPSAWDFHVSKCSTHSDRITLALDNNQEKIKNIIGIAGMAPVLEDGNSICGTNGENEWTATGRIEWVNEFIYNAVGTVQAAYHRVNWAGYNSFYTGMDGKIYMLLRTPETSALFSYNIEEDFYTRIVGIAADPLVPLRRGQDAGPKGNCEDGTLATECPADVNNVFVDKVGNIYFGDADTIRTIDSEGRVYTIAGQRKSFGDGRAASSARFGTVKRLGLNGNQLIALDETNFRFRKINLTEGGTVQSLAGTGSPGVPASDKPALGQSITLTGWTRANSFVIDTQDPEGPQLYFKRDSSTISRLNLSQESPHWVDVVKGSTAFYNVAADGKPGSQVRPRNPHIFGINGNKLLVHNVEHFGNPGDIAQIQTYDIKDAFKQKTLLGSKEKRKVASFCVGGAPGSPTPAADCEPGSWLSGETSSLASAYDARNDSWLITTGNSNSLRKIPATGEATVTSILKFRNGAGTNQIPGAFVHLPGPAESDDIYYYCNTDHQFFKQGMSTNGTSITVPFGQCYGAARAIVYSADRGSIFFPFISNGLFGVMEYELPQ